MRNGHIVMRLMLSSLSMGATVFRSDNTIPYPNPLFDRGDVTDPKYRPVQPKTRVSVYTVRTLNAIS